MGQYGTREYRDASIINDVPIGWEVCIDGPCSPGLLFLPEPMMAVPHATDIAL